LHKGWPIGGAVLSLSHNAISAIYHQIAKCQNCISPVAHGGAITATKSSHTEPVCEFEATLVLDGMLGNGYAITCNDTPINSLL
jgi:hypothetical protein